MKFTQKAAALVLSGAMVIAFAPAAPAALAAEAIGQEGAVAAGAVEAAASIPEGIYQIPVDCSFGMIGIDAATVQVAGGQATITVKAEGRYRDANGNFPYDAIWIGSADTVPADINAAGVAKGKPAMSEDGKHYEAYTYTFTISTKALSEGIEFVPHWASYFKSKDSAGHASHEPNSWNPKSYKMSFGLSQVLTPSNQDRMFNVVSAQVAKDGDGKNYLAITMSSTGYEYMIPGTYSQALASQKGADKTVWLRYQKNADGKYTFRIPISLSADGVTRVPFVSVSARSAKSAETANPQAPDYSKAFRGRLAVIDLNAKTLTTGNYQGSIDAKVSSSAKGFEVANAGSLDFADVYGDSECTLQPTITLTNATYDKAFIGTAEDAKAASSDKLIDVEANKAFTLPFANARADGAAQITNGVAVAAFHNAAKGNWVERTFTMDVQKGTISISGAEDPSLAVVPSKKPAKKPAKKVTKVIVNAKTVTAKAVKKAIGKNSKTVKTVTLGSKVKKVSKKAFAKYKKVATLELKTKKLTKKSVKGSLKSSKVKTVKVSVGSKKTNRKYVKQYKKIFTKANAGKKVKVK